MDNKNISLQILVLNDLLRSNAIDQSLYNKAIAKLRKNNDKPNVA